MGWFERTGAQRPLAEAAKRDPTIRKADGPPRLPTADEIADSHDALMSSLGGTRTANMDFRAQQLAKYEAAERQRAAIEKADHDRAESYKKPVFVLPSEQRKRQTGLVASHTVTKADTPLKKAPAEMTLQEAKQAHDDASAALLRHFTAAIKDGNDDGGSAPSAAAPVTDTKVKPGTSNVTHTPSDEGVYSKQDRRTVFGIHHVNRKVAKSVHIQKDLGRVPMDLTYPFTWKLPA